MGNLSIKDWRTMAWPSLSIRLSFWPRWLQSWSSRAVRGWVCRHFGYLTFPSLRKGCCGNRFHGHLMRSTLAVTLCQVLFIINWWFTCRSFLLFIDYTSTYLLFCQNSNANNFLTYFLLANFVCCQSGHSYKISKQQRVLMLTGFLSHFAHGSHLFINLHRDS